MHDEINVDLKAAHYFPHLTHNYGKLAVMAVLTAQRVPSITRSEFTKQPAAQAGAMNERVGQAQEATARLAG